MMCVPVDAERFREALRKRGFNSIHATFPVTHIPVVTIEMYLREGSFIPWVANRLSTSLNLNPDEYAPINAIALDDEPENDDFLPEAVRITSKDMNKIADLVVEKLLDAFEYRPEDKPFIMVGKSE